MIKNINNNKTFFIIPLLILIFFGTRISTIKRQIPPIIGKMPDFNMLSHSGELITSDNFNDKYMHGFASYNFPFKKERSD